MKRITPLFQVFFKIILIFLLCFVWVRYFVRSLVSAVTISAILTFVIDLFLKIIFSKRIEKQKLKEKELKDAQDIFFSMAVADKPLSFFEKVYKDKNELSFHKHFFSYIEDEKKVVVFPIWTFKEVSVDEITQVVKSTKKEKPDKIIILGDSFSKESFSFVKNFTVEILLYDKFETYNNIYKKNQLFPQITKKEQEKKKLSFKELLVYSFDRKRAKGYLFSALALLFSSLFVSATLYYSIVASCLLVFSLISLTSPFTKKETNKN